MAEIQRHRGLYVPLIIDEPNETLSYDREAILAFDGCTGTLMECRR
jgi:hypothetical protein